MRWQGQTDCLSSHCILGHAQALADVRNNNVLDTVVVVTDVLTPADVLFLLQSEIVQGVIVRSGSLVDHSAVLLNGRGIQLAIAPDLPRLESSAQILIDGRNEMVFVDSDAKRILSLFEQLPARDRITSASRHDLRYKNDPVFVHVDGKSADELASGISAGANGVGILRTEWIEWDSAKVPDLETQELIYSAAAESAHPYQLNVRLFDLGGDKIPRWAAGIGETLQSPMGDRGVRALPLLPEAFLCQLQAICNVARHRRIGIVVPMVTDVDDIQMVRQRLLEIADENVRKNIQLGAMIEVPAAAVNADKILAEADFIRIGPGDLTQFTLARLRASISPRDFSGRHLHPAVCSLIGSVVTEATKARKSVSMCLDLEPREPLLKQLLAVGVRTFCVSPSNVDFTIRRLSAIPEVECVSR